jgi:hypothetical protein
MSVEHLGHFLVEFFLLPMGMRPWSTRQSGWFSWLVAGGAIFNEPSHLNLAADDPVRYLLCGAATASTL